MKIPISFTVNGNKVDIEIEPWWTLSRVLREELNLTGVKVGCETGDCGVCTILVNGEAVKSCLMLAAKADGKEITTIEGLAGEDGGLHPLQQAFIDHYAVQCGFCTSGMILTAKALLDENPSPTEDEIRLAMSGNLCRCTGYVRIIEAIRSVAKGK
jgi:aerobic-type carbon monoxide dehydrogenase small subunit (CoxS/CutS family)